MTYLDYDLSPERPNNHRITTKEITEATKQKTRAYGEDELPAACLKYGPKILNKMLAILSNILYDTGYTPIKWQNSITILLHKKGPQKKITNYRPITLLNAIFKTRERILETRLRSKLEASGAISELQLGSRKKRDTQQAILTTRILLSQAHTLKQNICLAHVDLSKAYNRAIRDDLWSQLIKQNIQGKPLRSTQSTYSHMTETIRIE